jgi:hypothetical protein
MILMKCGPHPPKRLLESLVISIRFSIQHVLEKDTRILLQSLLISLWNPLPNDLEEETKRLGSHYRMSWKRNFKLYEHPLGSQRDMLWERKPKFHYNPY